MKHRTGQDDTLTRTPDNPSGAGAVTARGARRPARCGNCHKVIFLARNGDWYHERNATVICYFGTGNPKKAFPRGERA